jgi:hypothetical protein
LLSRLAQSNSELIRDSCIDGEAASERSTDTARSSPKTSRLRGWGPTSGPFCEIGGVQRRADEVALRDVAAERKQQVPMGAGFDPFRTFNRRAMSTQDSRMTRFASTSSAFVTNDDYGTGYSSMQQLARIAFTELKIDQSIDRPKPLIRGRASVSSVSSTLAIAALSVTSRTIEVVRWHEFRHFWDGRKHTRGLRKSTSAGTPP